MDPFSGASRLLAIFVAGLLVGAVSIGYIAPTNLGSDGSTGTVAAPGADGVLIPLPNDAGTAAGAADPGAGGGPGVDVGPGGGSGATGGGSGTTGGGSGTTGTGGNSGDGGNTGGGSGGNGGSGGEGGDGSDGGGGGGSTRLSCDRGGNGGATDRGVTQDSITLRTTVVESGVGSAFLADVKWGMEAVVRKVNSQGGICGRLLDTGYRDDGWKASDGRRYLNSFIEQGAFAIPVGPSSEGLNAAIEAGDFDRTRTPVVGTDGLVIAQYECTPEQTGCQAGVAQQWVWPVAAATVANARIIAKDAFDNGAEDFSIVFDRNFRFGREAARAFNAEVKRLTGSNIPGFNEQLTCQDAFCGIEAGSTSYSGQVNEWRDHRGDFTALFMEPQTAQVWMGDNNTPPASQHDYGASQTLFTRRFAENCGNACNQMQVWTGFKPFLQQYQNDPAVRQYVNDVKAINNQADHDNQFVEGGYIGMKLLVEALEAVGPNLTRDRLKATLDKTRLSTGLTLADPLTYSPDNRYVATSMQRWTINHPGTFSGWQDGPVVKDPCPAGGIGTC